MSTPAFPSNLPNPELNNYSFKPGNPNIRTDMEAGLARVRRRFVAVPTEIQLEWIFSLSELLAFETFYENELYNGSAWFTINLVNGAGQTSYIARFKEPYTAKTSVREFAWSVTATLETISRPLATSGLVLWDGGLSVWDNGASVWS